jgi:hypothetical protein
MGSYWGTTEAPVAKTKLWAGLGVTSPALTVAEVKNAETFSVSFVLVNDGDKAVNPEIEASHFPVNGKEPKDWGFVIGNGPRGDDFYSLPPGRSLRLGYALGERYFSEPGTYRIQWKGKSFESPVVEFRVLPVRER